jgi:GTPase SAR1 family protein
MTGGFYRGSQGFILVYDVTSLESFQSLEEWIRGIGANSPTNSIKLLVGNKDDLTEKRQVSKEMAKEFAEKNSLRFTETNAKEGAKLDALLLTMLEDLLGKNEELTKSPTASPPPVTLEQKSETKPTCW